MYRVLCLVLCSWLCFLSGKIKGQDYNIGIRAGLGFSKFLGPQEAGITEDFDITSGFHFGINFQWNFNEFLGWRTELLYSQLGANYEMNADNGAYIFNDPGRGVEDLVFRAQSRVRLKHSNAYLLFPQTFHLNVSKKLEVFGGGYIGFLLSPVATGTFEFEPNNPDAPHAFIQGLNFQYFSDPRNFFNARQCPVPSFSGSCALIIVDDQDVDVLRIVESTLFWNVGRADGRFKSIDMGLIGGASYFINRGLYVMGRVEYGLRDITRNYVDYSFANVNDNGTVQYRDDFDRNFSIQLSLGFRF